MTANIIGPGADREGHDHHNGIILGGNSRPNPHRFRRNFLDHFMLALGIFTVIVVLQSRHGSHQPEKSQQVDNIGKAKNTPVVHEAVSKNLAHDDILDSFTGSAAEYVNVHPASPELLPEDELRITVSPHLSSSSSKSQNLESIEQERDRLQRELDQSQVLVEKLQLLLDQQSALLEGQQLQLPKGQGQTLQQQQQQQQEELQTANSPVLLEQAAFEADGSVVNPQETVDDELIQQSADFGDVVLSHSEP
ncbi:hypothetical protein BGZ82_007544 [Podila clonocystis]|nr:hypothetical protein BGZ82_007544 [Podila clonocystis]